MKRIFHTFLEQLITQAGLSLLDILELIESLPTDNEEAAGVFCDKFELGNWFYEQLIAYDIDIAVLLELEYKMIEEAGLVAMENTR